MAAEQAVKRPPDLLGQRVVSPGRRRDEDRCGLPDQAAVEALDLAEPADQVDAAAPAAGLEVSGPVPRFLAARADQNELVTPHATPPRALTPLRVALPHAAAVTGHLGTPS
jgi:hypothetical protein